MSPLPPDRPSPPNSHWPSLSLDMLGHRARLLQRVRAFFDQRGFLEVQTPCLSADTVVDMHLDPPSLDSAQLALPALDLPPSLFLQTSPEFAMKRLLTAGATAIYQLGPVFRAGERGRLHNPEFTMLEWYRVGDSAADAMDLLDAFSQATVSAQPCRRQTYRETFRQILGLDPIDAPLGVLQNAAAQHDARLASTATDRDDLLDLLFSMIIQPALGTERPTIVSHYPLSQAALAQVSRDDPQTAERFEWFAGGVELGNGYGELLDADVLTTRAAANNAARQVAGRSALPVHSRLEAAMREGLPACAGVAVGFDRLLMVAQSADSIDEVLTFPIERA